MRIRLCLLLLLCACGSVPQAQRECPEGQTCGGACISSGDTCAEAASAASTLEPHSTSPSLQESDTLPFVASSRGRVYYPRGCSAAKDLSRTNLIGFANEEAARAAGYSRSTSRSCGWAAPPPPSSAPTVWSTPYESTEIGARAPVCTVARVSDGDTVACEDGRRIRLLLIDTPEMSQGPYGAEAKRALEAMLPVGSEARVELDVDPTDRYGRVLAYLYDDGGRMLNEEMARLGYALMLTYPPNVRHVERIAAAVREAREARRGLWSGSAFECTPRDHRARRCGG